MFRRLRCIGLCVSHQQTLKIVKQLGENYDETVKKWKKVIEMRAIDHDDHQLANCDSDSSWCTDSDGSQNSDSENEFEMEQFSTTGETCKIL